MPDTAPLTSPTTSLGERDAMALARGLGWFSIGLGLAEVLAPHALARGLGMPARAGLLRAYGVREIGAGIGALTARDPTPWIQARAAGDALDLATLAAAYPGNRRRGAVLLAVAAVLGATLLDAACADALARGRARRR